MKYVFKIEGILSAWKYSPLTKVLWKFANLAEDNIISTFFIIVCTTAEQTDFFHF